MRRNASGQKITAMMRTASPMAGAIVSMPNATVSTASSATPCLVTCAAAHGLVPGNIVAISGVTSNANAIGTFRVGASGITTLAFSIYNPDTGAAIAGSGSGTGGTVVCQSVSVTVTKDGGTPTLGTGTLTHIGRQFLGEAYPATAKVQVVSSAATFVATAAFVGNTNQPTTGASVASTTLGLWSYAPTAGETNAASVSFTFTSPATVGGLTPTAASVSVTQSFEPTAGPILLQTTIATLASQTSFTLTAGAPDDNTYNGYLCVVYDTVTEGQVAIGVVSAYVVTNAGATKTVTLLAAPLNTAFTMAGGDFVTLIADPALKPVTMNRNLDADADGRVDVIKIAGTTQTARDIGASVVITSNIKKNQALAKFMFLMTDSTTHAPVTGKTVTVTRSIDGAAFAAGALSAVTELSDGLYGVDFAAADLNGNVVMLKATAAACDVTFERIITQQ